VREKTVDVAERLKSFFYGFTAGETTKGGKYLEFCVQGTAPSSGADALMMYCKDVSSKGELHIKDEDGNEVQITSGGGINAPALKGTLPDAILEAIYPVGIVVTLGVSTNPATLFGIGTWTAIAGKVIVGINAGDAEFDTLNETGGEKTHTLTEAEMPAHTHTYDGWPGGAVSGDAYTYGYNHGKTTRNTSSTGSGTAHNNLQPYIVKYVWERTA